MEFARPIRASWRIRKPLRQLDFASLSEMCFWGAKVLHFRSVELAQSQNVPLV
jgi:aspartate kinase